MQPTPHWRRYVQHMQQLMPHAFWGLWAGSAVHLADSPMLDKQNFRLQPERRRGSFRVPSFESIVQLFLVVVCAGR